MRDAESLDRVVAPLVEALRAEGANMANRVQIALPEEDYAALSKLAEEEDRTIAGQARHMLRRCLGEVRLLREARTDENGSRL